MIISLTGTMGCGKSSVGRRLSQLLCLPFTDLDQMIQENEGRSIPEIFEKDGEKAFRDMELKALRTLIQDQRESLTEDVHPNRILALGGGTVTTPECAEIVRKNTFCIYLRASVDTLTERLSGQEENRPMLASSSDLRSRITALLSERSEIYEKTARIIIDTDGKNIEHIASEIIARLG